MLMICTPPGERSNHDNFCALYSQYLLHERQLARVRHLLTKISVSCSQKNRYRSKVIRREHFSSMKKSWEDTKANIWHAQSKSFNTLQACPWETQPQREWITFIIMLQKGLQWKGYIKANKLWYRSVFYTAIIPLELCGLIRKYNITLEIVLTQCFFSLPLICEKSQEVW